MKILAQMSGVALRRLRTAHENESEVILPLLAAAGYEHSTREDIRRRAADGCPICSRLSRHYTVIDRIDREYAARRSWHGSTKPIPGASRLAELALFSALWLRHSGPCPSGMPFEPSEGQCREFLWGLKQEIDGRIYARLESDPLPLFSVPVSTLADFLP